MANNHWWTKKELALLRKEFPRNYTSDILPLFPGRSYKAIAMAAFTHGVTKSARWQKKENARQAERLRVIGKKFQFPKGVVANNKGVPMSPEKYAKCSVSMFSKGHLPANMHKEGHETLHADGYMYKKHKGTFRLKHHLIWERYRGKIPKGSIVVFKTKDTMNFKISNLELIDRVENMRRNTMHRFPVEVKETMRLLNKLKKVINEKRA